MQKSTSGVRKIGRSVTAALTAIIIAVAGVIALPTAAMAATGAITEAKITVLSDGTGPGNPDDASTTDGNVSVRGSYQVAWEITANALEDGVISSTLPEGFTWNSATLAAAGLNNPGGVNGYVSTYTLSPDGRTVTMNISLVAGGSGAQTIEFRTISVNVAPTTPLGTQVTPGFSVTDGAGTREITATPLTVVGVWSYDLAKGRESGNPRTSVADHDFGAGPVPAVAHQYLVAVDYNVGVGGPAGTIAVPFEITDTFSFTNGPDPIFPTTDVTFVGAVGGVTAELVSFDEATSTSTFRVTAVPANQNRIWIRYLVWVPLSEVPNQAISGVIPWTITNTANVVGDITIEGNTAAESNPNNNTVTGPYSYSNAVVIPGGGPTGGKWLWTGADALPTTGNVPSGTQVGIGQELYAVGGYRAGWTQPAGRGYLFTPTAVTLYDFWDNDQQEIDLSFTPSLFSRPTGDNAAPVAVPASETAVFVTTDDGPSFGDVGAAVDPSTLTWVSLGSFAGADSEIRGVQIVYTGNGGLWAPPEHANAGTGYLFSNVKMRIADGTYTDDLAYTPAIRDRVIAEVVPQGGVEARPAWDQIVYSRQMVAHVPIVGVGVNPVTGEATTSNAIVAGDDVQYTITPRVDAVLGGEPAGTTIPGVGVRVCLPVNLTEVDLSGVSSDYTVTQNTAADALAVCGNDTQSLVTFLPVDNVEIGAPMTPIVFRASTSALAPTGGAFVATSRIWLDGRYNDVTAQAWNSANATITASQTNVAMYEKSTSTPAVQVDDAFSYRLDWFNFLSSTRGNTAFVDVLPFAGDSRGNTVDVQLEALVLTANAAAGVTVQIATDEAVRTGTAGTAPAAGVTWIDYDTATPEQITATTAIRVMITDFVTGQSGVGGLDIQLTAPDAVGGETIRNTATGILGIGSNSPSLQGAGTPVEVEIVSSSVSGKIVDDANDNGAEDADELGIGGVTVTLTSDAAEAARSTVLPATTVTAADGTYTFESLRGGDYTVTFDEATLPAGTWKITYDEDSTLDASSGTVSVPEGSDVADVDWGVHTLIPAIELEKSVLTPGVAAGEVVTFEFTITNAGETDLTGIALTDHLEGVSDVTYAWPSDEGNLAMGASMTATATYTLTAADIDTGSILNTADVVGTGPDGESVIADAEATLDIAAVPAIDLVKEAVLDGNQIEYTLTITNTGNVTLTDVALVDPLFGLMPAYEWTWPGADFELTAGSSATAVIRYDIQLADRDRGSVFNLATASGVGVRGGSVVDVDDVTVSLVPGPAISLVKSASFANYIVTYDFTVRNTGDVTLTGVSLTDELPGLGAITWVWPAADGTLAPGAVATATATYSVTEGDRVTGSVHNVALATGNPPTGEPVSDEDEVTIPVPTPTPTPTPVDPTPTPTPTPTATVDPTVAPTVEPTTASTPTPTRVALPTTGSSLPMGVVLAAFGLLVVGGVLLMIRRRAQQD